MNLEFQNQYKTSCVGEKTCLDDYTLFQSLKYNYDGVEWTTWDHDITKGDSYVLETVTEELREHVDFHKFTQ